MQIKKILWPTDLSRLSKKALPYVYDLSLKYGAEVVLVYVADDMRRYDHIYGDVGKHLAGLQEKERENAAKGLEHLCDEDLCECPGFVRFVMQGDPAREILKLAEAERVDLIVMTTHSREPEADQAAYFGSVTDKVARRAKVPVLVVNPQSVKE